MTPDPTRRVAVENAITSTEPGARPGILVVDDDVPLLRMLDAVFVRQGFTVWTAADGRSAVDLYRRHQQSVTLVLLDVCMPGMDGLQTLHELRCINPGVRACFMSGFSGKYVPEELHSAGGLRFVQKPFDVLPLAEQMWQLASGTA
jgi:two-component system cell cycle sensor histidine kinase/response regulator CckA